MERSPIVAAARSRGAAQVFLPTSAIKCEGPRIYRAQAARDLACILDTNPAVASWVSMPLALTVDTGQHVPDFAVINTDGRRWFVDAPDRAADVEVDGVRKAAKQHECGYRLVEADEVYSGPRLRNAKDLLRYGDHVTGLGDRIRVLALLDEEGSITMAEALRLFQESKPIAGLASMILREMVEIDLDEGLIGPGTVVRRIRR